MRVERDGRDKHTFKDLTDVSMTELVVHCPLWPFASHRLVRHHAEDGQLRAGLLLYSCLHCIQIGQCVFQKMVGFCKGPAAKCFQDLWAQSISLVGWQKLVKYSFPMSCCCTYVAGLLQVCRATPSSKQYSATMPTTRLCSMLMHFVCSKHLL